MLFRKRDKEAEARLTLKRVVQIAKSQQAIVNQHVENALRYAQQFPDTVPSDAVSEYCELMELKGGLLDSVYNAAVSSFAA